MHERLRILHLTAGSDAGGLSRYIYDLCAAMHARGHEVAVAGERGAWHSLFADAPWPWIDVPLKGGIPALLKSASTLAKWIGQHPVDLLHTHYRRPTLVARRIQKHIRLPILYTVHLSDLDLRWPRNWLSDFGDHTHVASAQAAKWVIDAGKVDPRRVTCIPHGIDVTKFPMPTFEQRASARKRFECSDGDLVAAFVGRLDTPKNEEWLIDLADQTRQTHPNLRILLAGDGPHEPAVRHDIDRRSLSAQIRVLGYQGALPVYHAADTLLLPSLREGFSFVCAEAMCAGVPVLRTRTAGSEELIVENVTGRSCAIDRDAFLTAAKAFLSERDKLPAMGNAASEHIRSHFTFEKQLTQTLDLYRRLIGTRA